jgi:hypothetical protein
MSPTTRMSTRFSSKWVAKLSRNAWGVIFPIATAARSLRKSAYTYLPDDSRPRLDAPRTVL